MESSNELINIMDFNVGDDNYIIRADSTFNILDDYSDDDIIYNKHFYFNYDAIAITKNGETLTDFGEAWSGAKFSEIDVLMCATSSYANEATNIQFNYVNELFKPLHDYIGSTKTDDGVNIMYANSSGDICNLDFATSKYIGYVNGYEGITVLVDKKNKNVITEVENFYMSALYDSIADGDIFTYKSDGVISYEKAVLADIQADKQQNIKSDSKKQYIER